MKQAQRLQSWIVGISVRSIFLMILLGLLFAGCQNPKTTEPTPISDTDSEPLEPPDPDRPSPPVPSSALLLGDVANLDLLISADREGRIQSVSISKPSQARVFDEPTRSWVERHWKMPAGKAGEPEIRTFIAPIVYPKSAWPRGGKYPAPEYPQICLQEHVEGTVGLRLEIGKSGKVEATTLLASSGSSVLDAHTQEWVRKRWLFPPGHETIAYWVCCYQIPRQRLIFRGH